MNCDGEGLQTPQTSASMKPQAWGCHRGATFSARPLHHAAAPREVWPPLLEAPRLPGAGLFSRMGPGFCPVDAAGTQHCFFWGGREQAGFVFLSYIPEKSRDFCGVTMTSWSRGWDRR